MCMSDAGFHSRLLPSHASRAACPPAWSGRAAAAEFSSCAVPLVFWPPYFSIFADLFMGTTSALSMMQAEGAFDRWGRRGGVPVRVACSVRRGEFEEGDGMVRVSPLLADPIHRNVLLAAVTLGMEPLPFYQLQLDAFTRHKVLLPAQCRYCWQCWCCVTATGTMHVACRCGAWRRCPPGCTCTPARRGAGSAPYCATYRASTSTPQGTHTWICGPRRPAGWCA